MTEMMTPDEIIIDTLSDLADIEGREGDYKAVWGLEAVIMAYCMDTGMDADDVRQKILERRRNRVAKEREARLSIDQNSEADNSWNTPRALLVVDNGIATSRDSTANSCDH